ncbi:uncharacterized protein [Spinacia oleracea]|uniref:Thiolase N-terminal domain-containing protein n=1 Tax=Spinacia oleracea TaxID=3562 RepID=A0ABM3QH90_SPIOL|nr:uncharacterized protein LOC110796646 [Spinacia oleracea]XP_056682725.1 uncharacterized protein LOC110796646 [Spinacia oleracea]XP_056682726.1 uncharacterized protein LOC110796646 [Spinacia oleracea]XP_056682727.1 uncharacterized protein LOC110796646 [Spinacia oleracea]XP_056682728.1 uncharacterized protein LOC110796646 [Spinacia oleracea]
MESMSNAPKYIADSRKGFCLGHDTLVDGMLKDGLWDVYNYCGMGVCAESCAEHHAVTREDQVCLPCSLPHCYEGVHTVQTIQAPLVLLFLKITLYLENGEVRLIWGSTNDVIELYNISCLVVAL